MINNDIEKLLHDLPRFNRSQRADAMFYEKLNNFENDSEESVGFFGLFVRSFAIGAGMAAFVAFIATVSVSYRSDVVHGNFLYPVKEFGEKIELAFAFSDEAKIDSHIKFSDRRLEEADSILSRYPGVMSFIPVARAEIADAVELSAADAEKLDHTLADMHAEIAAAVGIMEASTIETVKAEKIITKIENTVERQTVQLVKMEKRAGKKTQKLIRKVSDGQKDFVVKIKNTKEKKDKTKNENKNKEKKQVEKMEKIEKREKKVTEKSDKLRKSKELDNDDDDDKKDRLKKK